MESVFKQRRGQRLTPRDIKRFGQRLTAELESLLPGCRCRTTPIINEDDGKAFVAPLIHRGRDLGIFVPRTQKIRHSAGRSQGGR